MQGASKLEFHEITDLTYTACADCQIRLFVIATLQVVKCVVVSL